jgi:hypothetical protein
MPNIQRLDRRRFLLGAGGVALALPMLEVFAPRTGFGQLAPPPKRVFILFHYHGRSVGTDSIEGGIRQDNWSPAAAGPLPADGPISPALSALNPIRTQIVTIDGIDNVVRCATGDSDGHASSVKTCVTCALPTKTLAATGPSIDYVLGTRLRPNASMKPSIIFPMGNAGQGGGYQGNAFYGSGGSPPYLVDLAPEKVIPQVFGPPMQAAGPPPAPSLHDRLVSRRASILDGVNKSFASLYGKLNAADRARLDAHAEFIRGLEATVAGGNGAVSKTQGCLRPDEKAIPAYPGDGHRGRNDAITNPFQLENAIQALACDITRVSVCEFHNNFDPLFPSELPLDSPLNATDWHTTIHATRKLADPQVGTLTTAFQAFGKAFTKVVQRLGEMTDVNGQPMIENTLVMWVSDLGNGSHTDFNIPVVLAGMPSAFPKGQGRHISEDRRTLGDLYAHVLRMVGGSDMTFGPTGTLGSLSNNIFAQAGFPKYINANTPLHRGPIDL